MALPPTKFRENLPSGSEIISGGYTDRQTDWWFEKPTFILESRLKLCHYYSKGLTYTTMVSKVTVAII
jgi:hypothetical protein